MNRSGPGSSFWHRLAGRAPKSAAYLTSRSSNHAGSASGAGGAEAVVEAFSICRLSDGNSRGGNRRSSLILRKRTPWHRVVAAVRRSPSAKAISGGCPTGSAVAGHSRPGASASPDACGAAARAAAPPRESVRRCYRPGNSEQVVGVLAPWRASRLRLCGYAQQFKICPRSSSA